MTSLGPAVRQAPYFDTAWAVARETMRRARHNIELIISRLDSIGYDFWDGKQGTRARRPLRGGYFKYNGKAINGTLHELLLALFAEANIAPLELRNAAVAPAGRRKNCGRRTS
jgi:hypothetical protein